MSDKEILKTEKSGFCEMNKTARRGGTVFFGSGVLAGFHIEEFTVNGFSSENTCSRCSEYLDIDSAEEFYNQCVKELCPDRIFLCFGDRDSLFNNEEVNVFIEKYEWLLYTISKSGVKKIFILPAFCRYGKYAETNDALKRIAEKYGCRYLSCRSACSADLFKSVKDFLRIKRITFADAFGIGTAE